MDLPEVDDRLNSWKEIAAFLGRTIRTVQRWEKTDGLPLRRGGPGQRGAVVASKREISEWWERRQPSVHADDDNPTADWSGWRTAALVVLAVAAVMAVWILRQEGAAPDSAPRMGRLLAASTSEGRGFSLIPLNATASALALSPSGQLAYVAIADERTVKVVDLRARRIVDSFETVDNTATLALSRDGRRLFAAGSSELGIVDLDRRTLSRFDPGGAVRDVHASADGRHAWVTLAQAGLRILDVERGRWQTVPTVGCPVHLTAAPLSRRLFVSYQCGGPGGRSGHDAIEIIDERERTPIIARAGPPLVGMTLAVSPDEQHVWADAGDACVAREYDRAGCPAGSGPVLHAFRAETLDHLFTIRVAGHRSAAVPIFFPDGTRLVLGGFDLTVVERGQGTLFESIDRESGFGVFTKDGSRFVALDLGSNNRGLVELEVSPPIDAELMRAVTTHWSGDGTANDIVGGTHAVDPAGLRFEPGRYGRAFSFDGADGVNFGRRLDADIAIGPATYTAWIKPTRAGAPIHIASRTSSHTWSWSITDQGRLAFCLVHAAPDPSCATGGIVGRTALQADRWYHVAVVRDDAMLTLFVDGNADGSIPVAKEFQPERSLDITPVLRLGAGPDGSKPFDGLIDEVMLFRRALSADDLVRIMRATSLAPVSSAAVQALNPDDAYALATQAYMYAYPLVLMKATRDAVPNRPINRFVHAAAFPTPNSRTVVRPNVDTLYSPAWLDLSREPVIMTVPDTGSRYYLIQMMDAWTETFAVPGTRTTGNKAGQFAIVGPGYTGTTPAGATVIRSPTNMVWVLGRIQTNGVDDIPNVRALQKGFRIEPMSGAPSPPTAPAGANAALKLTPPQQVAQLDAAGFFAEFMQAVATNRPHDADAAFVTRLKALGIVPGRPLDPASWPPEIRSAIDRAAKDAQAQLSRAREISSGDGVTAANGWRQGKTIGRYGTAYRERAQVARTGLGALPLEDAMYPSTAVDADGRPLTGAATYVMHFAKSEIPPVNAFWSMTLYDADGYFAQNPINRYAIGDRDRLTFNDDGSLDLYIQAERPAEGRVPNWLPAPAGAFNLSLRLYWPKPEALSGSWRPPAVQRAK